MSTLEDLTLGKAKLDLATGGFCHHEFNSFFVGFTKEKLKEYSDREALLKLVSRKTGNEAHKVTSSNGELFKVHLFGEVIEVKEYRYVVRSGLLFDPTLMPEGKTESLLVDEYLQVLVKLNEGINLEVHKLDKGEWISVLVK